MDRFEAMSAFVAVVEAGGFSAAARNLRIPLATVSRRVSELEAHLSVQLLTRTTRSIALTETGNRYFETARRLLEELAEAIGLRRVNTPRREALSTSLRRSDWVGSTSRP